MNLLPSKTPAAGKRVHSLCTSAQVFSSRSEEHTSELQSQSNLVCRLLLEKKKKNIVLFVIVVLLVSSTLRTLAPSPAMAAPTPRGTGVGTSLCGIERRSMLHDARPTTAPD